MHFQLKVEFWPWWQLKEKFVQGLTIKVRGELSGCSRKAKSLRQQNQVIFTGETVKTISIYRETW